MSYNPEINRPTNLEEWETLIIHFLAKEDEKAAADPAYQKQTREQIETTFACYYPQPEMAE